MTTMKESDDKDGPDCGNICDIVYELLCSHCKHENRCHGDGLNHYELFDCTMRYLKRSDEFMLNKYERK